MKQHIPNITSKPLKHTCMWVTRRRHPSSPYVWCLLMLTNWVLPQGLLETRRVRLQLFILRLVCLLQTLYSNFWHKEPEGLQEALGRRMRPQALTRGIATRLFYSVCPRRHEKNVTRVYALFLVHRQRWGFTITSLFLRLITTRICSIVVIWDNKSVGLRWFLLADAHGRSVYMIRNILSDSRKWSGCVQLVSPLPLYEHVQDLGYTSCSVLNFFPGPIYYRYKWALVHCPHTSHSLSFSCLLSEWCTFLRVFDRNGNRLHRRRWKWMVEGVPLPIHSGLRGTVQMV